MDVRTYEIKEIPEGVTPSYPMAKIPDEFQDEAKKLLSKGKSGFFSRNLREFANSTSKAFISAEEKRARKNAKRLEQVKKAVSINDRYK